MNRSLQQIQNDLHTIEGEVEAMKGYSEEYPEHFANLQQDYLTLSEEYQEAVTGGMSLPPEDATLICADPDDDEALPNGADEPARVSGAGDRVCLPGAGDGEPSEKEGTSVEDETAGGGGGDAAQSDVDRIPASGLSPHASGAFKTRVYNLHVDNASRGRNFNPALDSSNVATVESGQTLRADAAAEMIRLLSDARTARETAAAEGDEDAAKTTNIAAVSGYRSADTQFTIWDRNFAKYYEQTSAARARLEGGEHGAAAAAHLARYIGGRVAAPGYSLHQSGIAMDLATTYRGTRFGPNTAQAAAWRNTWLFNWLSANAATYRFHQNTSINEPWHWEYR